MQVQAVIETTDDHRFRVRSLSGVPVSAEGDTREQALNNFRVATYKTVLRSVEVITVDVPDAMPDVPVTIGDLPAWQAIQGSLNEEEYKEFMEAIYENRRRVDEQEEAWRNNS